MFVAAADPPVRADGLCAQCFRPIAVRTHARRAPYLAQLDPFCSAWCCRVWHKSEYQVFGRGAPDAA